MAGMINIVHRDGREYAVLPKDFERNKDGQYDGFKAGAFESGEEYEPPAPKDAPAKSDKPAAASKDEK